MKTKKTFAAIVAFALAANLAIAGMAMADDATATLDLSGGTLTLSLDGSALSFGSQNVSTVDADYSADFPRIEFGDLRSDATYGFTLNMSTTAMSDGVHIDIPYANLAVKADASDTISAIDSSDTTGVSIESAVNGKFAAFIGSDPSSDPMTLVSADARERVAGYEVHPIVQLTVPAHQAAGTYTGTLTVSIQ